VSWTADVVVVSAHDHRLVARLISAGENHPDKYAEVFEELAERAASSPAPVIGVTGTGGSGKSSLVDELVRRFLLDFDDRTIAVVSVDPSKRKTGGRCWVIGSG
jgi:isobutyryl-CoA mutase